jgi:hypothetical protein
MTPMGDTGTTIVQDIIRQALAAEDGVTVSESGEVPNTFEVPDTFDFKKAPTKFKLIVFKKTLEEIIRIFEENKDYQKLPQTSVLAIKDGLIDTNEGFFELLENRISIDAEAEIKKVQPFLMDALTFAYDATSLLEDQGRRSEYYGALLKCRQQISQIKLLLKAWKIEKDAK